LCGSVHYAVHGDFEYALNCHCSKCRRATGSAFKSLAGVPRAQLTVTKGGETLLVHGDAEGAHDVHCGTCGSLLFSVVREGAFAHLAMGTLVTDPGIAPSMHIFVGSKAPWYEISDDLPQHATFPG
jgi:hypothetical protein